jgi:hypothetical protein
VSREGYLGSHRCFSSPALQGYMSLLQCLATEPKGLLRTPPVRTVEIMSDGQMSLTEAEGT